MIDVATLARWVAAHEWLALSLTLVLALSATIAGAVLLRQAARIAASQTLLDAHPLLRSAAFIVIAFALIVGAAHAFAELAESVFDRQAVAAFDEALAQEIGRQGDIRLVKAAAAITHLADPWLITIICALGLLVLLGLQHRTLALVWLMAIGGNALLNTTLKQVFERVRPLHDDGLVSAQGFSFPSGHSSAAVVTYGMLAYVLIRLLPSRWHLPTLLFAVTTILAIGASRIWLRVHFASDVLAGLLSGATWLLACVFAAEARHRRLLRLRPTRTPAIR